MKASGNGPLRAVFVGSDVQHRHRLFRVEPFSQGVESQSVWSSFPFDVQWAHPLLRPARVDGEVWLRARHRRPGLVLGARGRAQPWW